MENYELVSKKNSIRSFHSRLFDPMIIWVNQCDRCGLTGDEVALPAFVYPCPECAGVNIRYRKYKACWVKDDRWWLPFRHGCWKIINI
jgi:hypothetical protein